MNKILLVPDPVLRQKANHLNKITLEDIKISKLMIEIMLKAPGVGLAANQIGILKKIITLNIQNKNQNIEKIYALFNPKIISFSKEKKVLEEGCLSLPNQYANIERPEKIIVEYLNEKNKKITEEKYGFEARVLQHEIDHLNGKLFVDYLSPLKRKILIKKVIKETKLKGINER